MSCSNFYRKPSSTQNDEGSISALITELSSLTANEHFIDQECKSKLPELSLKIKNYDWSLISNDMLKASGKNYINEFWQIRLQLHSKLEAADASCLQAIRMAFSHLRETEDYLGEFIYTVRNLNPSNLNFQEQPIPIYNQKSYPPYLLNPKFANQVFSFENGDLMIARGVSFISAIISQLSNNQSQFSHVVFVHVDKETKKEQTIESYIGSGVNTYDMDFALKNENVRLLVLRSKDATLANQAAEKLMSTVEKSKKDNIPISYDYSMDFDDHSKMSCAEVARAAYEWGSNGQIIVPSQPAVIKLKNDNFLKKIKLQRGPIFTPDDLETDPRFDLVLEWKDYRLIRDSRYKDVILSSMMHWVGELNYEFHDTLKSTTAKHIIRPSRKTFLWPLLRKLGVPNIDSEIPKNLLGTMTVLAQVGEIILTELYDIDSRYITEYGRSMTSQQLKSFLEKLRYEDLKSYVDHGYSKFHYALKPKNVITRANSDAW